MNHENQTFKSNVAGYLANHSIVVPTCFTDNNGGRGLHNGHVYNFDLQTMAAPGHVHIQGGAFLVLLTIMANRGLATGFFTSNINAMWLEGPSGAATAHANLPPAGINFIFTVSLGGCSVYINGGQIFHNPHNVVPVGVPANQRLVDPYPGTAGNFDQTCAVAYFTGGAWHIGGSVPHDNGPFHRTHAGSGYRYLGY